MSPHPMLRRISGIILFSLLAQLNYVKAADEKKETHPFGQTAQNYAAPQLDEPTGELTLPQALALALLKNPELAAYPAYLMSIGKLLLESCRR